MRWPEAQVTNMAEPSREARDAIEEARHARADNEAVTPLVRRVGRELREHVAANHFIDLIEATIRQAAGERQ